MSTNYHFFNCTRCDREHINHTPALPKGWTHDELGDVICDDCTDLAEANAGAVSSSPPLNFTHTNPSVENFFATYRPRRQSVSLFFDEGHVEFTLDESEAIASCLASANAVGRGQHPAQMATAQGS